MCKEYTLPYPDGDYVCSIPPLTYFGPIHKVVYRDDYTVVLVPSNKEAGHLHWVSVYKGDRCFPNIVDIDDWIARGCRNIYLDERAAEAAGLWNGKVHCMVMAEWREWEAVWSAEDWQWT